MDSHSDDNTNLMEQVIQEVLRWIEDDISKPLLLVDVAAKSGYSKWYFHRCFKQKIGCSVASYIRMRRLTISAALLKNTTLTVARIYGQVGYSEQSLFTKSFRLHFGLTPCEYRKSSLVLSDRMFSSAIPGRGDELVN